MTTLKKNPILNEKEKDLALIGLNRARFFFHKILPKIQHWEPQHYKNFHQGFFALRQSIHRITANHTRRGLTQERLRFILLMKNFHLNLSHGPFYFSDPDGPGFQELLQAFQPENLIDQIEYALESSGTGDFEYLEINTELNKIRIRSNLLDKYFIKRINLKMQDYTRDAITTEYLSRLELFEAFSPIFVHSDKKWFDRGLLNAKYDCLAALLELTYLTFNSSLPQSSEGQIKKDQQRVMNNHLQQFLPKKNIERLRQDFKTIDGFNQYTAQTLYKIAQIIGKRHAIRPLLSLPKPTPVMDAEKSLLTTLQIGWKLFQKKGTFFHLKNAVIKMRIHASSNFVSAEFRGYLAEAEKQLNIPACARAHHSGTFTTNQIWI